MRGTIDDFAHKKPVVTDVGFVVEVADCTLRLDRMRKTRIYGRAGIPSYWILNLEARQIEVHSNPQPSGARRRLSYRLRQDYVEGDSVPVILAERRIGEIAVASLLP